MAWENVAEIAIEKDNIVLWIKSIICLCLELELKKCYCDWNLFYA